MAIDLGVVKKINNYVYEKPRTIQEIAHLIKRNWRTAESYVKQISSQMGTISLKTFRKGTKGAVKIAYWNNTDPVNMNQAQRLLMKRLQTGRTKHDFSPFDIYQYVNPKKRSSFFEEQHEENIIVKQGLIGPLQKAKKQILIFSGNFSWANTKQQDIKLLDVFEKLAKKGVYINILVNIDMDSISNIRKIMGVNTIIGKDRIEVRHCEQPLRSFIVDDKFAKIKEIKNPDDYDSRKKKKTYIFYEIYEDRWVNWLQKVFWNFFSSSIPAKKRIENLKTVQRL